MSASRVVPVCAVCAIRCSRSLYVVAAEPGMLMTLHDQEAGTAHPLVNPSRLCQALTHWAAGQSIII